jgi:hypothetical protein
VSGALKNRAFGHVPSYGRPHKCPQTASKSETKEGTLRIAALFQHPARAPPSSALRRLVSSSCAVTNMIGTRAPSAFNRRCNSSPSIPGIRKSKIKHSVSRKAPDSQNKSAEAKVSTSYPTDLRRLFVEARIDSSSSTIEITAKPKAAICHGAFLWPWFFGHHALHSQVSENLENPLITWLTPEISFRGPELPFERALKACHQERLGVMFCIVLRLLGSVLAQLRVVSATILPVPDASAGMESLQWAFLSYHLSSRDPRPKGRGNGILSRIELAGAEKLRAFCR